MKLIVQPNGWSCLPTAFAIALGVEFDFITKFVEHDGSQVVWPNLPEPERRRGFHIQEMIDVAYSLEYLVTPIEPMPTHRPRPDVPVQLFPMRRSRNIQELIANHIGVFTGEGRSGKRHAVAWDGNKIHDPNGTIYDIDGFGIECFWMLNKIKSASEFFLDKRCGLCNNR
jgi:hypothetical protein